MRTTEWGTARIWRNTKCIVTIFLACNLIAFLCKESSALQQSQNGPANVKVVVKRVKRVSSTEAHFWLKVVNKSQSPVFLEASPFDKQVLEGLYLEQWRTEDGWEIVVPCRDLFSSDARELKPDAAMPQEFTLAFPLSAVCKVRNIHFEGRFRFHVDYFESRNAVRTYMKQMNSSGSEPPLPAFAVSEPFEIPLSKK